MNQSQMEKTFGGPIVIDRPQIGEVRLVLAGAGKASLVQLLQPHLSQRGVPLRRQGHNCPYAGCNADVAQDASEWKWIRRMHPDYPLAPWLGIRYPLNAALAEAGR